MNFEGEFVLFSFLEGVGGFFLELRGGGPVGGSISFIPDILAPLKRV